MALCQFVSSSVPAFSAAANYLSISGSFTAGNGAVCSFPSQYAVRQGITPVISTAEGITTCSVLAPPYSAIECPSMSPGTYTMVFNKPNVPGVPEIAPFVFVVPSPEIPVKRQDPSPTASSSAAPTATSLVKSSNGQCGVVNSIATTCTGTKFGACCSQYGWCGDSDTHCLDIQDCQSGFGDCKTSPVTPGPPVTRDGHCGAGWGAVSQTCTGQARWGPCCSSYGWCGYTDQHCLPIENCQSEFGTCSDATTPAPPTTVVKRQGPSPTPTDKVSKDGSCGGADGFTCPGSGLGDCCSPYGWCGDTSAHCGAGCQKPFGNCATPTGSAPLPTTTNKVSLDGTCGGTAEQTCIGSEFGSCCSEYGFCGSTEVYCAAGCQSAFGTCSPAAPAPSALNSKRSALSGNIRAARYAV